MPNSRGARRRALHQLDQRRGLTATEVLRRDILGSNGLIGRLLLEQRPERQCLASLTARQDRSCGECPSVNKPVIDRGGRPLRSGRSRFTARPDRSGLAALTSGRHDLPIRAGRRAGVAMLADDQREQSGVGWADAVGAKSRLSSLYSSLDSLVI